MKPVYSTVYVRSRGFLGGAATVHVGEFVIDKYSMDQEALMFVL